MSVISTITKFLVKIPIISSKFRLKSGRSDGHSTNVGVASPTAPPPIWNITTHKNWTIMFFVTGSVAYERYIQVDLHHNYHAKMRGSLLHCLLILPWILTLVDMVSIVIFNSRGHKMSQNLNLKCNYRINLEWFYAIFSEEFMWI